MDTLELTSFQGNKQNKLNSAKELFPSFRLNLKNCLEKQSSETCHTLSYSCRVDIPSDPWINPTLEQFSTNISWQHATPFWRRMP